MPKIFENVDIYIVIVTCIIRNIKCNLTFFPHRAIRPDVIVTPELINLKRCFINYPYTIEITLTNQSIEPASYQFVEQLSTVKEVKTIKLQTITNQENDSSEESKLQYSINNPEVEYLYLFIIYYYNYCLIMFFMYSI